MQAKETCARISIGMCVYHVYTFLCSSVRLCSNLKRRANASVPNLI